MGNGHALARNPCYAPAMAIPILPALSLPESELEVSYILASGPGGQNVNKVATAAQLRFDAAHSLPTRPDS